MLRVQVNPEDPHCWNWTVLELGYLYGRLHVELLRSTGKVPQQVLFGCKGRAVSTCPGLALPVCPFWNPTVRFGGSAAVSATANSLLVG
jgi:hypothetical protein